MVLEEDSVALLLTKFFRFVWWWVQCCDDGLALMLQRAFSSSSTCSSAQPKQPERFSFTASIMRRMLPSSKMVAPMKAVQPPATTLSLGNSVAGSASGSQTKNALKTQTTEPSVNITATHHDTSQ